GKARIFGKRRGPDVEVEAILARAVVAENHVPKDAGLHAAGAELRGFANTFPGRDGLGSLPAQLADGRRGVGNALEDVNFAVRAGRAFDFSGGGFHLIRESDECRPQQPISAAHISLDWILFVRGAKFRTLRLDCRDCNEGGCGYLAGRLSAAFASESCRVQREYARQRVEN